MFNRFSFPARRAVMWARREAGRLGSEGIEPEDLLVGLLIEDQGETARAAASFLGKEAGVSPQPGASVQRMRLRNPSCSGRGFCRKWRDAEQRRDWQTR